MYKKHKSITQPNSTIVKSKITLVKNNHKTIKNQFLEYKFVTNNLLCYYYYISNFKVLYISSKKHNICVIINYYFSRSGSVTAEMDPTGSVAAVDAALERLNKQRLELEQLWATRKLKLDLCLRLRIFERDALEVKIILH